MIAFTLCKNPRDVNLVWFHSLTVHSSGGWKPCIQKPETSGKVRLLGDVIYLLCVLLSSFTLISCEGVGFLVFFFGWLVVCFFLFFSYSLSTRLERIILRRGPKSHLIPPPNPIPSHLLGHFPLSQSAANQIQPSLGRFQGWAALPESANGKFPPFPPSLLQVSQEKWEFLTIISWEHPQRIGIEENPNNWLPEPSVITGVVGCECKMHPINLITPKLWGLIGPA